MPSEPNGCGLTLVFPGQGTQSRRMLDPFRPVSGFDRRCARASELLGFDVRDLEGQPETVLNSNRASSLLTVLASVLGMSTLPDFGEAPLAVAGYSVGQWTALHAAGALDELALFELVAERARLMDEALAAAPPSGMLAVIGVRLESIEALCARSGGLLQITNLNAPNQVTLGGSLEMLSAAECELAELHPRVLKRIPVAGAWHSDLMSPVVEPLRRLILRRGLVPTRCPVIENTSASAVPAQGAEHLLARQVAAPVLWMQSVRALIGRGARTCLEVGWGDMLTRFGFFIDRSVKHQALAPAPGRG